MGRNQKSVAIGRIILILVVLFQSGVVFAKDESSERSKSNSRKKNEVPAVVVPVAADGFSEDISEIDSALHGQISGEYLKEAKTLKNAIMAIEQDDPGRAVAVLEGIKDSALLGDYIRYYRSIALKQLGRHKESLGLLPESASFARRLDSDIFWHRMDLLALTKQVGVLRQGVQTARKRFGSDRMAAIRSSYFLGKGLLLAGQKRDAVKSFLGVLVVYPGSEYDDRIFALLKKFHVPVSDVLSEALLNQRAERLIDTGYAYKGSGIYKTLAAKNPASYREKIAYGVFRERRYREAAQLYADIIKSGNYTSTKLDLLTYLAQAYARHDDFAGALDANERIIKGFPGSSAAALAKFKIGFLYFDSGQYRKAADYFGKYVSSNNAKQRVDARRYRFWSYYFMQDYANALVEVKSLLTIAGREENLPYQYWTARLYELMGKSAEAKLNYGKVAAIDPKGYYGLLAGQRLGYGRLEPKTIINESLLKHLPQGRMGAFEPPDFSKVTMNDVLLRSVLLYRAGLDAYAYDESRIFLSSYRGGNSKDLVSALQFGGNYYYSYSVKDSAIGGRVSGCDRLCGYQVAYPRAYKKYVEPFSRHWGVEDNLGYAVMRQESVFKPEALSYAYAYGLMQIIPPTGEEIAAKIHYSDFHPSLLNRPKVNTLFGTYYLSYLMGLFNHEPVFAMAGYNAGPDAVGRWVKKYGANEIDVFVEMIPYAQTSDYVKKVLVNYLTYRKIYQ